MSTQLPAGFTLDESRPATLPAGFTLDPEVKTTTGGALFRGLGQGLTFGLADELEATKDAIAASVRSLPWVRSIRQAIGTEQAPTLKGVVTDTMAGKDPTPPSFGQAYDKSLAEQRDLLHADQAQHGTASFVGNIGGGIAGTVAGTLLAPELTLPALAGRVASVAGRVAAPVAEALPAAVRAIGPRANALWNSAPAAVQTGARWIGNGALYGTAGGFGSGEGGFGARAENAAEGGAAGAVIGPVAGVGGLFAGRLLNRLGMGLGLIDPGPAADRQIIRSLERGGRTVDDVAAGSTAAGDAPVTVMDLGGRPTVNLGAVAANTPSTAVQRAEEMVQARRGGRPERMEQAGNQAFGGGAGGDIATATAERQAQRERDAAPLYREAFSQPAGMTDNMGHILNDPIGQQGLRRGLEIQRIENASRRARGEPEVPTEDPAIRFNEQGDPEIVGVPNMRSLDAVKRGMDAIIEDARDKTSGRVTWTERLRAIEDMRRTWVNLIDEGNPAMAAARAAWAGPSAQLEATAAGRGALKADRDIVARRATSGPPDVQDAYRLGAGRAFADMVSNPGRDVGVARNLLEDRTMQARLRSLLGPEEHQRLNAALQREAEMGNVEQTVSPRAGSHTMRLGEGSRDLGDMPGPLSQAVQLMLTGHPMQSMRTVIGDLYRTTAQNVNPRIANALGDRLFTTDQGGRDRIIAALRERQANDLNNIWRWQRYGGEAVRGLGQGAGVAVGP